MKTKIRVAKGSDPLAAIRSIERELNRIWSTPVFYAEDAEMTEADFAVILDGSANTVDYTLLDPSPWLSGMIVFLKCIDDSFAVTLVGTVDDGVNYAMTAGEGLIMKADGDSWRIYAQYIP
jgi:hypothetical protein